MYAHFVAIVPCVLQIWQELRSWCKNDAGRVGISSTRQQQARLNSNSPYLKQLHGHGCDQVELQLQLAVVVPSLRHTSINITSSMPPSMTLQLYHRRRPSISSKSFWHTITWLIDEASFEHMISPRLAWTSNNHDWNGLSQACLTLIHQAYSS